MLHSKISYMAIPAVPKLKNGLDMFVLNACKVGGIQYNELMSKDRHRNIMNIRHILAYELIVNYKHTHIATGKILMRNHSSMVWAKKKYENLYATDIEFKQLADKINKL